MLLSIVSSSAIYSSAIFPSAASAVTSYGLPKYGNAVIVGFIILLSLKEVLSETEQRNISLNNSFNLAIISLSLCFFMIVSYKIASIIVLSRF